MHTYCNLSSGPIMTLDANVYGSWRGSPHVEQNITRGSNTLGVTELDYFNLFAFVDESSVGNRVIQCSGGGPHQAIVSGNTRSACGDPAGGRHLVARRGRSVSECNMFHEKGHSHPPGTTNPQIVSSH